MQRYLAITIAVLLFSASFFVILTLNGDKTQARVFPEGLYVGVTADGNLTTTIRLIDKVNKFSNMLVILNPEIVKNQTKLTEVCDYAQKSGMSFYIHMSHPSYWKFDYNPFEWYYDAKEKYKENFLGIYLYDEPGGNQLDLGPFREFDFEMMPYDYRDAANTFTYYLYVQMRDFIKFDKIVTSDYGLFWFDYEAGYDVIFCEFGQNRLKEFNIPLCRGAAELHNKMWGVMITWTYDEPPYLESPEKIYGDMILAYETGASYITIFNFPIMGPYGLLDDDYFDVMENFQIYVNENPRGLSYNENGVAYVLPENYGWGMRNPIDKIWGVWEADDKSSIIWGGLTDLVEKYGYGFDVVYDCYWTRLFAKQHYSTLIWWNGTVQELS